MCGRYTGFIDESQELSDIYTAARSLYPDVIFHSGEIFPTNTVPLLTVKNGILSPIPAAWGFPGFRGKEVIINARAETAAEKYTFADSLRHRRCIVPTTGYYEWSKEKKKFLFRLPDENILFLAGLYKECTDGVRFVILTTSANSAAANVHHRMPVILGRDHLELWGRDEAFANEYLRREMTDLIKTAT